MRPVENLKKPVAKKKTFFSDPDDGLSMYPTIPDGQEGEIDYGDFDSRKEATSTSFQDPYAAEYPALPVEAPTGPDRLIQPRDLPPWYEDEYYDDRRMGSGFHPALIQLFGLRFLLQLSSLLAFSHITLFAGGLTINLTHCLGELGQSL